jgi:menaquinol-cytochrome c reductase iron-sulfur subunit
MSDQSIFSEKIKRKSFIMKIMVFVGGIMGLLVTIPVIGALIAPLLRPTPQEWRRIGKISDFETGKTVLIKFQNSSPLPWSGKTSQSAAWLRKISDKEFLALAVNCTHLGCPVRWEADAELFMCPCHGGIYNKDGSRAAGPPPRGLHHYSVRLRNNEVEILTRPVPITNLGA